METPFSGLKRGWSLVIMVMVGLLMAALAALVTVGPLSGQTSMDRARSTPPPAFIELVEMRAPDVVSDALTAARAMERDADREAQAAKSAHDRMKSEIEIAKRDTDAVKARIDLAKKEKRESDRARLELDKTQLERLVRVLEKTRDLYEAEQRHGQATRDLARAHVQELEAEQRVRASYDRLTELGFSPPQERDHITLERRYLNLLKTRVDRSQTVASREETVVERKVELLEARSEWLAAAGESS